MKTDLPVAELDAGLEWYRESRGIDAGSPEWAHMLEWFSESLVVDAARLDRALTRFRGRGDVDG